MTNTHLDAKALLTALRTAYRDGIAGAVDMDGALYSLVQDAPTAEACVRILACLAPRELRAVAGLAHVDADGTPMAMRKAVMVGRWGITVQEALRAAPVKGTPDPWERAERDAPGAW